MKKAFYFVLSIVIIMVTSCISRKMNSSKQDPKTFSNTEFVYKTGLSDLAGIIKDYITVQRKASVPKTEIPVLPFTAVDIEQEQQDVIYKLGHSSLLLKLSGKVILIDPVFSERVSPVQWAGPKRFHQPPIDLQSLLHIDVVLISHDHYDHLDKQSVKELADKVNQFLVPKRIGKYLAEWGVDEARYQEFDWWQSHDIADTRFTFTPTQHFSGRGMFDRDTTLWGSWVIKTPEHNLYFSGDSGYFSGFKEIGERYGPFDLTLIETGAYNKRWSQIHMFPEQSVQANIDLQGKVMMPIHNSTFDLALHDWHEPLDRVLAASERQGVDLITPEVGQRIEISDLLNKENKQRWWQ